MEFDRFSIYGFKMEYPASWTVTIDQKSKKMRGEVWFISPKKEKIVVSWSPLEEAKKEYTSLDMHVDHALERIRKMRGHKSVETVKRDELEISGHRVIINHLGLRAVERGLLKSKEVSREARSLQLYCEESGRYFVAYGLLTLNDISTEYADAFEHMKKSFRCHTE